MCDSWGLRRLDDGTPEENEQLVAVQSLGALTPS